MQTIFSMSNLWLNSNYYYSVNEPTNKQGSSKYGKNGMFNTESFKNINIPQNEKQELAEKSKTKTHKY